MTASAHTSDRVYTESTPLVSVIVPLYNAADYIVETLDSILASQYPNIEVIIVDDGSTDHSLSVAQSYVLSHSQCRLFTQPNSGVSAARNYAISRALGKYILPVDADDKISPTYIAHAVPVLEQRSDVRIVGCEAWMFGQVDKPWRLPKFSHALLARKNMIHVSSLFRKADWQTVGGFCQEDIFREDWDFWLSLIELGGTYYRLPEIGFYYRVRKGSRRANAKQRKRAIVDAINRRHPAYLRRYLHGPLHYQRTWSRFFNFFRSETQVGDFDAWTEGSIIYHKRNCLRQYKDFVTKQFATPSLWRGIIYGLFCKSKARRCYEYAHRLGALTPRPIAYREIRYCGILRESFYTCQTSSCPYTFNDLIANPHFPNREQILQSIGRFTALLHRQGVLHLDYSGGNILFNADGSEVQIVDINRLRFCHAIAIEQGLKNFERLNIDRAALCTMATAYAQAMGYAPAFCCDYVISHRWKKHIKQHITHLDD